jgi:hypothetical protein
MQLLTAAEFGRLVSKVDKAVEEHVIQAGPWERVLEGVRRRAMATSRLPGSKFEAPQPSMPYRRKSQVATMRLNTVGAHFSSSLEPV